MAKKKPKAKYAYELVAYTNNCRTPAGWISTHQTKKGAQAAREKTYARHVPCPKIKRVQVAPKAWKKLPK